MIAEMEKTAVYLNIYLPRSIFLNREKFDLFGKFIEKSPSLKQGMQYSMLMNVGDECPQGRRVSEETYLLAFVSNDRPTKLENLAAAQVLKKLLKKHINILLTNYHTVGRKTKPRFDLYYSSL